MAKTQKLQIIIEVNGSQIDNVLAAVHSKAKAAAAELEKMAKAGKSGTPEFKKQAEVVKALANAHEQNVKGVVRVEHAIKNLSATTTRDLRRALAAGKKALDNMTADNPGRQKLIKDLQRIQTQINRNTGAASKSTRAWNTALKNLVAYSGVFGAFNQAKTYLEDTIRGLAKMSDQLADIRKVSGLTTENIKGLSKELAKVDTRTSQADMLNISYQGAKLGMGEYGTEGLVGFTKAANQVNVALKEDLGDDALTALSKFTENMGLIKQYGVETAMLKAGSAMFKLSATSTATSQNIVEFTKRMMAAGRVAGLTADQILALGSAADSMNLMPEVASTAMSRFLGAIQVNHNLIEKKLKIEPGTINSLYSAGHAMDAMVLVMEKMQGKNMNQLDFIWKDLGSDGTRLKNVVTSMVSQLPMLQKHLAVSAQAFKEGSAVTQEYNIQQETANALIERAGNLWQKAFVNSDNVDVVHEMAQAWYDVSKSLTTSQSFIVAVRLSFWSLGVAIKSVMALLPVLISALAGASFGVAAKSLVSGIKGIVFVLTNLRFVIQYVRVAWVGLSTVMKGGWIGAAIGLLVSLVGWLYNASKKTDEQIAKMRELKKNYSDFLGTAELERRKLDSLVTSINEAGKKTKERQKLIAAFNQQYGQYLKNMLSEKATAQQIAQAYREVARAMRGKLAAEGKQKDYVKYVEPSIRQEGVKRDQMERALANSSIGMSAAQIEAEVEARVASGRMGASSYIESLMGRKPFLGTSRSLKNWKVKGDQNLVDKGLSDGATMGERNVGAVNAIAMYVRQVAATRYHQKKVDDTWRGEDKNINAYNKTYQPTPGALTNDKPDKAAIAAAKAAARDRKRGKREDLEQAKKDSTAIISTIEEYYTLQQTAIEQMVADNKLLREDADNFIKENKRRKNLMLEQARLALAGDANSFDEMRKNNMGEGRDMADFGQQSRAALDKIRGLDVEKAHKQLARFDGDKEADSSAFLNEIRKNAAKNRLEASKIAAEQKERIVAILNEDDFIRKAARESDKAFSDLGFTRNEEQFYGSLAAANSDDGNVAGVTATASGNPYRLNLMRSQFRAGGTSNYGYNIFSNKTVKKKNDDGTEVSVNEGDEEARRFLDDFTTGGYTDRAGVKHTASEWLPAIDIDKLKNDAQQIKAFYLALTKAEDDYYESRRQAADRDKKIQEERWNRSDDKNYLDGAVSGYERESRVREMNGTTTTAMQDVGFAPAVSETDPEVLMYEAKLEAASRYYEQCKQFHADEQTLLEAERAQQEAALQLSEQVAAKIQSRMDNLTATLDPLQQFSEQVGVAFVEMASDASAGGNAIRNAVVDMVKNYAQMTLKMLAQQVTQRIKRALFHKQMEQMEKKHNKAMSKSATDSGKEQLDATKVFKKGQADVTEQMNAKIDQSQKEQQTKDANATAQSTKGNVFAGIASGASKIIAKLGWWGIPLVAVITGLLQGLLNKALSKLTGGGDKESAGVNTKLVTGMLTYDAGNVQQFRGAVDGKSFPVVGTDGRVYAVEDAAQLQTGIVTKPLLTTVGGEPSIVAERGPEMVIGRETTAAMMMSRPDIIREIVRFDRNRSGVAYRAYDVGNVARVADALPQTAAASSPDVQTLAVLQQLAPVLSALTEQLKTPIRANVNMWGRDGLYEQYDKASRFMRQNGA